MTIKCIITDDEPIARKGLSRYVERIPYLELVTTCEDAIQLGSVLEKEQIDLLFLDINMPDLSGMEFLKLHKRLPRVILTTAYPEYALEGYSFDVLDYLLKPIPFERFYQATEKAKALINMTPKTASDHCFLKCDKRIEKIYFTDVLYVESMQNYVCVHTKTTKLIAHLPLKKLKAQLPEADFLQTHKSFVVALDKIEAIEGNSVLIGPHRVPISKYQKKEVMERILGDGLIGRE